MITKALAACLPFLAVTQLTHQMCHCSVVLSGYQQVHQVPPISPVVVHSCVMCCPTIFLRALSCLRLRIPQFSYLSCSSSSYMHRHGAAGNTQATPKSAQQGRSLKLHHVLWAPEPACRCSWSDAAPPSDRNGAEHSHRVNSAGRAPSAAAHFLTRPGCRAAGRRVFAAARGLHGAHARSSVSHCVRHVALLVLCAQGLPRQCAAMMPPA